MTDSTKTILLLHHGTNLAVNGDYTGALATFDTARQLKPDCAAVYFARGMCHAEQGNDTEAFADYTEAIRLKPDFEFAIRNRDGLYKKWVKSSP
jgi:Flp pilus assembly protein TadD